MLKIPKPLKKKKKSKKSKKKDEELFTEAELKKYKEELKRKEAEQAASGEKKVDEEWSKFKDLTTGVDSILKKTQGDLDRIKSTSFFQREAPRVKEVDSTGKEIKKKPVEQAPQIEQPQAQTSFISKETSDDEADKSDYAVTDDESEEEEEDDIFDTSYVEAVERGEVKLAYVPDSPEEEIDDSIFDTSYAEPVIKGQDILKQGKVKKALDIGVAVEVLTGRIDNVTITTTKRKRIIPGNLLFEDSEDIPKEPQSKFEEPQELSILDVDSDLPIYEPIDLSVSLHTEFIKPKEEIKDNFEEQNKGFIVDEEDDEFTQLAAESLTNPADPIVIKEEIKLEPVLQDSWSVFEADNKQGVFAESVVEDELGLECYIEESDPFDTTFADNIIPQNLSNPTEDIIDDDFDPRAGEITTNNRRKSSVHIHLTDPFGLRESISSDKSLDNNKSTLAKDLLAGSSTDLSQLDEPIEPLDINYEDIVDPFDTTAVANLLPGKVELKLIEQELVEDDLDDFDFDPRAEEPINIVRKPSRPENLFVQKSVAFHIENPEASKESSAKKPVTPFYTREISISEEDSEVTSSQISLPTSQSNQNLKEVLPFVVKRRHSEFPGKLSDSCKLDLLCNDQIGVSSKVLTPYSKEVDSSKEIDPFDTSFTGEIVPCKTEIKLLTKEFSEDLESQNTTGNEDLLAQPDDDLFHRRAISPQQASLDENEDIDPFDTSFAADIQPGRTELKLLESELLN